MNKNVVFLLVLLNCPLAFGLDSVEIKKVAIEKPQSAENKRSYCLAAYCVLDGQTRTLYDTDDAYLNGRTTISVPGKVIPFSLAIDITLQGAEDKKMTVRKEIVYFDYSTCLIECDFTLTGKATESYNPGLWSSSSKTVENLETNIVERVGLKNGKTVKNPPNDFLQVRENKSVRLSVENENSILKAHCELVHCLTSLAMTLPPTPETYEECIRIISVAQQIEAIASERLSIVKPETESNKDILVKLEEKALHIRNSELDRITTANIYQLKNTIKDGEKEINEWKNRIDELEKTRKVLEQYKEILELALPTQAK